MNLVIELLNREKDFITNLKYCKNADEQELQMLAEIDQALQLLQSCVSKSVCKHCDNKLCDSQIFNEQCFKCGKKPL